MSDIPSIRKRRRRLASPGTASVEPASPAIATPGRFSGWWKLLVVAVLVGGSLLVCTSIATRPTAAPEPTPAAAADPEPSVQVPQLSAGPELGDEPPTIVRVHPEPAEDHKGCYVLAGVAVPLTDYHLVDRPRGTYLTASLPLLCTTGEDLRLRILLDCPPSRLCRSAGLFSQATRTYYTVPPENLELHYKRGTARDSYPTHLLVLRPTRLKQYATWGLDG